MQRHRSSFSILGPEGALRKRVSLRDLSPLQVPVGQNGLQTTTEPASASSLAGGWSKSRTLDGMYTHENLALSPVMSGLGKTRSVPHFSGTPVWSRRSRRSASVGNIGSMAVAPMRYETRDMRERRLFSPREESRKTNGNQDDGKESSLKNDERRRSSPANEMSSTESKTAKKVRMPESELDSKSGANSPQASGDTHGVDDSPEAIQRQVALSKDWQTYRMDGGRCVKDIIDRSCGFSGAEIARVHQAFVRFAPPDMFELDKDALYDICIHLGYHGMAEDTLNEFVSQVSDFSTYNLEEVVDILEKYSAQERDVFTKVFNDNLAAGNDVLDMVELGEALRSICITTTSAILDEMLTLLKIDKLYVTENQFVDLMVLLCVSEGFRSEEIAHARQVFERYAMTGSGSIKEPIMKLTCLFSGLLDFLGPSSMQFLKEGVVRKLSLDSRVQSEDAKRRDVTFHEFIIWARRVREMTYDAIWQCFETALLDSDEDDTVSREGLRSILQDLGFTLFDDALSEICLEAGVDEDSMMNFDAVVALVKICHQTAGFRKSDVAEFGEVFQRFDYDNSGSIENVELLDLLRYLGYSTSLEDVRRFLVQADANADGSMTMLEFLRQMRLLREHELTQGRAVFETMSDQSSERLPVGRFEEALQALDQVPGQMLLEDFLKEAGSPEDFDFKEFIDATDSCRKLKAQVRRTRAGFSDEEYVYMRDLFQKRCKPGSNELEKGALLWFLMDFDVHVTSLEERRKLFERLETARIKALEAGVEEKDAGKAASPTTLYVFMHFLQGWRQEEQHIKLNEEEKVMDQARFSLAEVQEFRVLFLEWVKKSGRLETDESEEPTNVPAQKAPSGRRSSLPSIVQTTNVTERQGSKGTPLAVTDPNAVLSTKYLQLLLASIGLQLNSDQKSQLDTKVRQIIGAAHGLDFGAFLLLMRWMLDTNFADINGASKKVVDRIKQSSAVSPSKQSGPPPSSIKESVTISPSEQDPPGGRLRARRRSV